jgi:hypothetical protein
MIQTYSLATPHETAFQGTVNRRAELPTLRPEWEQRMVSGTGRLQPAENAKEPPGRQLLLNDFQSRKRLRPTLTVELLQPQKHHAFGCTLVWYSTLAGTGL